MRRLASVEGVGGKLDSADARRLAAIAAALSYSHRGIIIARVCFIARVTPTDTGFCSCCSARPGGIWQADPDFHENDQFSRPTQRGTQR
jgi:hypothetical protein